jgi:hypothetical protein
MKNEVAVKRLMNLVNRIPLMPLAVAAIFMALAPFSPEPHLLEKSRMLIQGELTKGIDIFDLFWHSFLIVLLVVRLASIKSSDPDRSS